MMKRLFTLLLAGLLALSMVGCSNNDGVAPVLAEVKPEAPLETPEPEESSEPPQSSAAIKDPDLFSSMETVDMEGNVVDSSVFAENKLTLVNVWNIGCTPCIYELGTLDQLNKDYADKGVAIRGLYNNNSTEISEEERAEIAEIMAAEGAEYPQWLMSQEMLDTETFKDWNFFPGTFFVDSQGNIVDMIDGSDDYEGWQATIEELLKQVEENA